MNPQDIYRQPGQPPAPGSVPPTLHGPRPTEIQPDTPFAQPANNNLPQPEQHDTFNGVAQYGPQIPQQAQFDPSLMKPQPHPSQPQPLQQPSMPQPQPLPTPGIKRQRNLSIIPLIILIVLLLGTSGFAAWAFMGRQDYKNNVDQKIEAANKVAVEAAISAQAAEFAELEKLPTKEYRSPSAYGDVRIVYPKTWAAYVIESDRGSTPVEGYFHPDFVPDVDGSTAFALHVEVLNDAYDKVLGEYESGTKDGTVKVSAYRAPGVQSVSGSRIDGEVIRDKQGSTVLFPLRDKTLRITTQSENFKKDFDNIVLENLAFIP